MSWRAFFGGVIVAFLTIFVACLVLIAAAVVLFDVLDGGPAGVASRLGDVATASALLACCWTAYAAIRLLCDPEESPLRRGPPAGGVRGRWGRSLETIVARNSRPKCALGLVPFVLIAALGLLLASSAESLFYVADGWLCLLAGLAFSALYAFKFLDRRPQVTLDERGIRLGERITVGWGEVRAVDGDRRGVFLELEDDRSPEGRRLSGRPYRLDGKRVTVATALLDVRRRDLLELAKRRCIRNGIYGADDPQRRGTGSGV